MPTILNYTTYAAILIVGLNVGYAAGHFFGKRDGEKIAIAENQTQAATEAAKSGKQREKIDHETNKLPDSAVDAELSANGWMRR